MARATKIKPSRTEQISASVKWAELQENPTVRSVIEDMMRNPRGFLESARTDRYAKRANEPLTASNARDMLTAKAMLITMYPETPRLVASLRSAEYQKKGLDLLTPAEINEAADHNEAARPIIREGFLSLYSGGRASIITLTEIVLAYGHAQSAQEKADAVKDKVKEILGRPLAGSESKELNQATLAALELLSIPITLIDDAIASQAALRSLRKEESLADMARRDGTRSAEREGKRARTVHYLNARSSFANAEVQLSGIARMLLEQTSKPANGAERPLADSDPRVAQMAMAFAGYSRLRLHRFVEEFKDVDHAVNGNGVV